MESLDISFHFHILFIQDGLLFIIYKLRSKLAYLSRPTSKLYGVAF